jgi:colanic acid/amylovoran biosynthesis glycosyltransferase
MPESATIAYLTSAYARASDSFIRGEVAQLRARGFTVHTFSIRKSPASELVSEEIRREHAATEFVLEAGALRLVLALLRSLLRSPRLTMAAARLAARTGTPGLKGRLWPLAYLLEAAYLAERLRIKGVEHLHNHIGEGSASVAMLASLLSGIPFSMTIHGPGEFDRPTLLALDEKIRRASFTVAVSDFGRSQLYRWSDPADWPKIHVVHCGLDGTFLDAGATPIPEARRLVCVGRLAEQKGAHLLVEAAGLLAAQGIAFELVLVGDGPLRRPIEELVERLGLRGHVRLAGWQGAEAVREEILRARALVLPSFAEGLPVVLMEALALGRPVISTYVAGIPELVVPGVCGWLVPAGSVEALAAAMHDALSAPAHDLERLGRAGAARAARRHDGAVEAAKLAALIGRSCRTGAGSHLDPGADDREQFLVRDRGIVPEETGQTV